MRSHDLRKHLKVQSSKLCNNKYTIASAQITNTEIFAFIAILVFKLLSRKVLFINRKDNKKVVLSKKIANFTGKLLQNYKELECEFQDTFETRKRSFISAFLICMTVPLI